MSSAANLDLSTELLMVSSFVKYSVYNYSKFYVWDFFYYSSCGKVMFSKAPVSHSVHGGGGGM